MTKTYSIDYTVHVLCEQHSEVYAWYGERVAQQKHVLGTKNGLKGQTCCGLGRRGA